MYRLIYQDGDSSQNYTFNVGEVVIGRSPECQVVLKDFGISRQHAKIVVDEDGARILDLKSKNGTTVNGVPVVEAPLKDGDRILLGKFQLTFSKSLEGKIVLDEAKPLSEEAGTIISSVGSSASAPPRARPRRAARSGTSRRRAPTSRRSRSPIAS
jgi:pSer/pThr/pTyr-binding forkhead associated (FHA) protein